MSKDAQEIQRLREVTGAGIMECKKAVEDAHGNFDDALRLINERGLAKFEKRSGRETGAGLIESYIHNGRIGVLLELRAETDFVVRSEPFKELAHELAMQIAAVKPRDVEELLSQPYIRDEKTSVHDLIKQAIAKVGENIQLAQFYRIEL